MMNNSGYSLVETSDGSLSLFSNSEGECMHTNAGAYEESVIKHVANSGVIEKSKSQGTIRVLDIGFGLGYNILALVQAVQNCRVEVVSLEYDKSIDEWLDKISFGDSRDIDYAVIRKSFRNSYAETDNYSVRVLIGDARDSIALLARDGELFDAVFQDPYSPSKNPELWSLDYFMVIAKLMNDNAILTTYSSALHIRRAMIESGLLVGSCPSTGIKKEGTIASKNSAIIPVLLTDAEIKELIDNVKSEPYRDMSGSDGRDFILERRIERMKKIREDRQVHPK
jgi:tRNA U34 5-methylaminomethyl-2-thiouridine-forming methyltransferase MnmC